MKKLFSIVLLFLWAVIFCKPVSVSAVADNEVSLTTVHIAGIITDASSFSPLENTKIYDHTGNLIATTDAKGYFNGIFPIAGTGEIHFRIKIEKDGYSSFTQTEHWAQSGNSVSAVYYIGMRGLRDATGKKAFSEMRPGRKLSYDDICKGLQHVKDKITQESTLEAAKKGNQQVFFMISGSYYLMSNTGWLKLNSPDEQVSIDRQKPVKASEVNSILKRRKIRQMTTSDSRLFSYELYTR